METPYFIWDYDLNENQIHAILNGNNETEKLWLMTRIMTHAKFEDIWKYVSVKAIVKAFPKMRLQPRTKQIWQYTLNIWGYHV